MLPTLVAAEVRETLLDYLRTTWSLSDRALDEALFRFLEGDRTQGGAGIFQGPYLRMRLPFEPAPPDARPPLELRVPYTPHMHQITAWQRLSSKDDREPSPTLVVTGTGSGKTEAFLMPILDHCLRARARGERGIKAIILYPMNALAADQARRIGEIVWGKDGDAPLRGKVRVGMYVGDEGKKHRVMGRDHVIDDRDQIKLEPPDVLLTNYKMLDFLLLRRSDRRLWEDNGLDTLRYLVLDELHTYDGAQGTDVACLVRRLGARLGGDRFCPVGTSATVAGDDPRGLDKLLAFASSVFDRRFERDAIVSESRRTPGRFFELFGPAAGDALPADVSALPPADGDTIESFVARAAAAFFPGDPRLARDLDRVHLGDRVARHGVARAIVELASASLLTMDELDARLTERSPAYGARSEGDRRLLLDALLAMISWAEREDSGGRRLPLLSVQVQTWIREVRRLVRLVGEPVGEAPRFAWRDEDPAPSGPLALPMYVCHACGHSGWISVYEEIGRSLERDSAKIGEASLRRRAETIYLHRDDAAVAEDTLAGLGDAVCVRCARLGSGERCSRCGEVTVPVHAHRATSQAKPPRDLARCPSCGADGALGTLASRAASLASVAIGHLYTTPFNSDRKLLAFSDSVQDASHRAGFFSGRTYRFTLRTAMLATVPAGEGIRLKDVPRAMMERWGAGDPAEMIAALMPRDLDYLEPYQRYVAAVKEHREERREGPPPSPPAALTRDLAKRLSWEVTREMGLAARIGRTLERVGSASARLDAERFERALAKVLERLPNRIGAVQEVPEARWRAFIAGLLTRLRLRGGVMDELLRLYFQREGHGKYLGKREVELLSPFGRFTSRPAFLTDAPEPKRFDSIAPRRDNWYVDWARRALAAPLSLRDATEVYAALMPLLVDAGLLVQTRERSRTSWGIDPAALWVVRDPHELACEACHAQVAATEGDVASLEGAPCLRYRCAGRLRRRAPELAERSGAQLVAGSGEGQRHVGARAAELGRARAGARQPRRTQTYYRRFYERGELGRVFAHEHTGLLEREVREDVEEDFKERHRPDAPNLLSCTPTLEMGIDIGDLSATMLLSVPPTTASYLQRVGRAGRKTGNALVLTFTTVRPHDLYFFDDPEAAMAGPIEPPGCYLDAPAILERQALAWCLDAWAREAPEGEGLPARVRDLFTGSEEQRFPAPFFRFVEQRRDRLREGFLRVFGRPGATSEGTRAALHAYLSGAGHAGSEMEQRLAMLVEEVRREREDLRRLHRRIADKLKALDEAGMKVENAAEEREELLRERRFLERELAAMQDQSLLGFLSERSALPNYAFPESGVTLRAYVSKEGGGSGGGSDGAERHKFVRAASVAIRELAPSNTFYAMARKVRIDTLDVGSGRSGKSGENIERWQLCAACGHMEPEATLTSRQECPRCGAPDWREKGRRRELVKMTKVAAFTRQRDAAFSDESDEREREQYVTQTFFDPDVATARHAWLDPSTPFGFELLPKLSLRELNFGRKQRAAGTQTLGGREVPDVAFRVCEECGEVHDDDPSPKPRHRRWCTARTKPDDKQPWRQVHLYREVTTEALRIFVPVAMLDPEVRLPNVRAALELGMRRFFGGDPDHLRVTPYDEPSREERESRRRFVVVHDTVPGGTGVLAELAANRGAKLREVLEEARRALSECGCAERGARACYRCLYAYRHQQDLDVLDRETALGLVEQLLGAWPALRSVDTIGVLDTATVTESELEQRLVDELAKAAAERADLTLSRIDAGRWALTAGGRAWTLEAQVTLDPAHDVSIPTRPDFVLWPEGQPEGVLAVAIYCDGAAFHVQPHEARARIADDFRKREAVRRSGRFRVVSLSWADLDAFTGKTQDIGPWVEREAARTSIERVALSVGQEPLRDKVRALMQDDPLRALLAYLADPDPKAWAQASVLIALGVVMADRRLGSEAAVRALAERMRASDEPPRVLLEAGGDHAWAPLFVGGHPVATLLVHAPAAKLGAALSEPDTLRAVMRLDDTLERRGQESFVAAWRGWLRAHAALFGLPGLEVVTTEQLLASAALELSPAPVIAKAAEAVAGGMLTERAREEIAQADERVRAVLERAMLAGAPLPEIPYEHGDGADGFDAQLEVGWPHAKVALALPDEAGDAAALREQGWTVLEAVDLDERALHAALGIT